MRAIRSKSAIVAALILAGAALLQAQANAGACSGPAWAVRRDAPVRVPFEFSGNHVLLTVCSGDRAWTFLLDTGAGDVTMDLAAARALDFKLGSTISIGGAGAGTVQGYRVTKGKVRLAGLDDDFDVGTTWEMRRLRISKGRPIHGILGMPFIDRYVMAIDFKARELVLFDRKSFKYGGAGTTVPLALEGGQPIVHADIKVADGERVNLKCLVDVGSSGSLLVTRPIVDQYKLRTRVGPIMPWGGGGGVGGPVTNEIGRVASVSIGGQSLTAVTTSLFGDGAGVFSDNRYWDANIGGDILRRFVVYFDYRGKRMILEPHAGSAEPFEVDMSGLRVQADSALDAIMVTGVNAGSPAAEAGVQARDVVLRVNGQNVRQADVDGFRERMRKPDATVELTVRRGGETHTLRFTTKRQI